MYANRYNDYIPTGYVWSDKSFSNVLHIYSTKNAGIGALVGWGWLYYCNGMSSPAVYYCPAAGGYDPNQWPLKGIGTSMSLSIGYALRPETPFWDDFTTPFVNNYNFAITNISPGFPLLPKLTKLHNRALLSEATYFNVPPLGWGATSTWLGFRHKTGMNVLSADGSGSYVRREFLKANLTYLNTVKDNQHILNDPKANPNFNTTSLPYQGIWADLENGR
jgi:hypothetical protein